MFDIAQFFKLRLGKQIYDSTISRSSMILHPSLRWWLVLRRWNTAGYLLGILPCWNVCGFAFETWQLHLINFFEWNMRKTFVFVLNVWRVNKCIWNVQINVHYSQSMYWLVENSTMFFLIKGLLFWVNRAVVTWWRPRASLCSYTVLWTFTLFEIISNFWQWFGENSIRKIHENKDMFEPAKRIFDLIWNLLKSLGWS